MKSARNRALFPTFHVTFICTLPRYTYSKIFSPRRLYTQKLWPKTYFSWTERTAHIRAHSTKLSMLNWSTRWVDQNMSWRHKLEMVAQIPLVSMWCVSSCLKYLAFPLKQNHKKAHRSGLICACCTVLNVDKPERKAVLESFIDLYTIMWEVTNALS